MENSGHKKKTRKRAIIMIAALVLLLTGCSSKQTTGTQQTAQPFQKVRHAETTVRDYGTIKLELDEGTAPITAANFVRLAKDAKRVDNNGTIPPEQQPVIERIAISD